MTQGVRSGLITTDDFARIEILTGTIREAGIHVGARKPAYRLVIDFGHNVGVRNSSAQITELYTPKDLIGRQVMAVVNLPPRRVANFVSEVLVLGFGDSQGRVVLAQAGVPVCDGARLH